MNDEPTDPTLLRPLPSKLEPKPSPLGSVIKTSEPERVVEKSTLSMPPTPEDKSDDFVKGYKTGYVDGKNKKKSKF